MGQARLQRHESDFLEDEAGIGRVLECYERTGVRTWDRWRKISLNVSIASMNARWTGIRWLRPCILLLHFTSGISYEELRTI